MQSSNGKCFTSVLWLAMFAVPTLWQTSLASPIAGTWIRATVKIQNEERKFGTGFLVLRELTQNRGRGFLVTNKHVVSADAKKRLSAQRLKLSVNMDSEGGEIQGQDVEIPLLDEKKRPLWREHENAHVDVLAIDITDFLNKTPRMHKILVKTSDFITPDLMKKQDVTIADEVLIVGYPDGITNARSNFPLVRQGLIATRIGETITIDGKDSAGKKYNVEIPGFLVDATVIGGSSGSPVILKPVRGLTIRGDVGEARLLPTKDPYLLGIVSATKYGFQVIDKDELGRDRGFPILQGLGIVYDAETIKETINLFFK